jgi:hypothetical protein
MFLFIGDIPLSATTITAVLPEFNGDFDTVGETYRVGTFDITIPTGSSVLSATLSGTYGNSVVPNSASVNVSVAGVGVVSSWSCPSPSNPCWFSQTPAPWSATLTHTQIQNSGLDLGTLSLNATQTNIHTIRLGSTTLTVTIPTLADLVKGAVTVNVGTGLQSGQITASFTPNFGYSLGQAAQVGGLKGFDWVQVVTSIPPPNPYVDINGKTLTPPFNDPPPGGYPPNERGPGVPLNNSYPFYYNPKTTITDLWSVAAHTNGNTLNFFDEPLDPCLSGGLGCNGKTAAPGSDLLFTTDLVGVNLDGSLGSTLAEFDWESDYTCSPTSVLSLCTGGVSLLNTLSPLDIGNDGIGGVALIDLKYNVPAPIIGQGLPGLVLAFVGLLALMRRHWSRAMSAGMSCMHGAFLVCA